MDAQNREHPSEIVERLSKKSTSFSFVQTVRLLLHTIEQETGAFNRKKVMEEMIRIRPELSLRFPGTDITQIEVLADKASLQYLITATFLGMYGASSPLPTFYTEDLIDEFNDDKSIRREFLDIINYAIYPLFFNIWGKYRLFYKVCEEKDLSVIDKLYSMLGLEDRQSRKKIHNIDRYFRYIGLTLQFPRSAEGLEAIISDGFDLKGKVRVMQHIPRTVSIPADQYALLGVSSCTLSEDAVIGNRIKDISGKFRIIVSDADSSILHSLLPDRDRFLELMQMVDFYVNQPLEWELVIEMKEDQVQTAQPGNSCWSNLGWNTWLIPKNGKAGKTQTVFKA